MLILKWLQNQVSQYHATHAMRYRLLNVAIFHRGWTLLWRKKCWARILVTLVTTSNQWETCWCFWHRQAGLQDQTIHENCHFCRSNPPDSLDKHPQLLGLNGYSQCMSETPIHQSIDIHSLESTWKNVKNPYRKPFGKWSTFMMASPRNINVSRRVSKFQKETVPVTNPISTSFFTAHRIHRTMVPWSQWNVEIPNKKPDGND